MPAHYTTAINMLRLTAWLRGFRPPAQLNLIFPLVLGLNRYAPCAASWRDWPLWQVAGLSLLLQAVIMYSNEASDSATDDAMARTLISGGAGVGAEGILSAQAMRRAAIGFGGLGFFASGMAGGASLAGLWLFAMGLIWAYDGQAWHLSRHPLGGLCQALGVGIVLPLLAGWSVAAPAWPGPGDVLLGLCLGYSGHILTALPDEAVDRRSGKRTIVVSQGFHRSFALMLAGLTCAAGLLLVARPPHGECGDVALTASLAGLCAVTGGLLLIIASWQVHVRGQPSRAPAGLPLELWLAALASMLLWSAWIVRYST